MAACEWCRLCCADVPIRESFLMRHGPIDYYFCNEDHAVLWEQHRLNPVHYYLLRSLPSDRPLDIRSARAIEALLSKTLTQTDA